MTEPPSASTPASLQCPSFVNRISGSHQTEEPEAFFGGIIADPMGLGKTLTMIALAATDLDSEWAPVSRPSLDEEDMLLVNATLVIVPPSCERLCYFLATIVVVLLLTPGQYWERGKNSYPSKFYWSIARHES